MSYFVNAMDWVLFGKLHWFCKDYGIFITLWIQTIFFFNQFYLFFNLTFVFLFQRAPSVWVPWYIDLYNSTCYPEEGIQFHIPKLWRWNDNFPDTKLLSINPDEQGKKAGFNYIDLTEPILILSIFPCNINQTICGFEFY